MFVRCVTAVRRLFVDGTDEANEGEWIFTSTNDEEPYFTWTDVQNTGNTGFNCVQFEINRFLDVPCDYNYPSEDAVVLCEVEGSYTFFYQETNKLRLVWAHIRKTESSPVVIDFFASPSPCRCMGYLQRRHSSFV